MDSHCKNRLSSLSLLIGNLAGLPSIRGDPADAASDHANSIQAAILIQAAMHISSRIARVRQKKCCSVSWTTCSTGCICTVDSLLVLRDISSPLDVHMKSSQGRVVHRGQRGRRDLRHGADAGNEWISHGCKLCRRLNPASCATEPQHTEVVVCELQLQRLLIATSVLPRLLTFARTVWTQSASSWTSTRTWFQSQNCPRSADAALRKPAFASTQSMHNRSTQRW